MEHLQKSWNFLKGHWKLFKDQKTPLQDHFHILSGTTEAHQVHDHANKLPEPLETLQASLQPPRGSLEHFPGPPRPPQGGSSAS